MSDDLVKRLRELTCNCYDAEVIEAAKDAMDEAADRIEKLEAALREMMSKCTWERKKQWCGSMGCHCQIARKALEGKDD